MIVNPEAMQRIEKAFEELGESYQRAGKMLGIALYKAVKESRASSVSDAPTLDAMHCKDWQETEAYKQMMRDAVQGKTRNDTQPPTTPL